MREGDRASGSVRACERATAMTMQLLFHPSTIEIRHAREPALDAPRDGEAHCNSYAASAAARIASSWPTPALLTERANAGGDGGIDTPPSKASTAAVALATTRRMCC